jgi:hypothetical protein
MRCCAGESDSEEQAISSDSEEQKRWRPQVCAWLTLQDLHLFYDRRMSGPEMLGLSDFKGIYCLGE